MHQPPFCSVYAVNLADNSRQRIMWELEELLAAETTPATGTLGSLLSALPAPLHTQAYATLVAQSGAGGKYAHVRIGGSLVKMQRPYKIGTLAAAGTHADAGADTDAILEMSDAPADVLPLSAFTSASHAPTVHSTQSLPLPEQNMRQFVTAGYTVLSGSGVLPETAAAVDAAARVLNHQLGVPGAVMAGGAQGGGLGKLQGASHT